MLFIVGAVCLAVAIGYGLYHSNGSDKYYENILQDRKIERDTHIIRGITTDPIQAIHLVREHIFTYYGHAQSYDVWKENADAVMFDWLRSDEAEALGIKDVWYMVGYVVYPRGTREPAQWFRCTIKSGQNEIPIYIDLAVGAVEKRKRYAVEGNGVTISNDTRMKELAYIVPIQDLKTFHYDFIHMVNDPEKGPKRRL